MIRFGPAVTGESSATGDITAARAKVEKKEGEATKQETENEKEENSREQDWDKRENVDGMVGIERGVGYFGL